METKTITFKDAFDNALSPGDYVVYLDINSNFTPMMCVGQVIDEREGKLYCKSWSKAQLKRTKSNLNTGRQRNVYLSNSETTFLVVAENVSERIKVDLNKSIQNEW